jgi:hypothetical protein
MHLTAQSHRSRSIGTGGRDPSERVVTIVGMRTASHDVNGDGMSDHRLTQQQRQHRDLADEWRADGSTRKKVVILIEEFPESRDGAGGSQSDCPVEHSIINAEQ